MAVTPKPKTEEISILEISQGAVSFGIIGTTPLIFNRMSEKAKRSLLLPSGRKNEAEKAANLKHDPIGEFRASVYRNPGDTPATRLKFPTAAFKGAMETAALDLPGTKKTEIGRLVSMPQANVDIYGIPKLLMSVVRSADMNRTPDIRTRAILAEWACIVTVQFVQPKLQAKGIGNLMAAGGITAGIGDWRQEKGSGNHGMYRLVGLEAADFKRIVAAGGRKVQDAMLDRYQCYDEETDELLSWYSAEIIRLGRDKPTATKRRMKEAA